MRRGSRIKNHLILLLILFSTTVISVVVGTLYFQLKATIKYYNGELINSSSDIMLSMMKTNKEEGEKIILSSNNEVVGKTKESLNDFVLKSLEQQNSIFLKMFTGFFAKNMENYEMKLQNIALTPALYLKKEESAKKTLNDIILRDKVIKGFAVYTETVDLTYEVGAISENYSYKEMAKQLKIESIYRSDLDSDNFYYIGMPILNEERVVKGYIVMKISIKDIMAKIFEDTQIKDGVIYLADANGKIIKHKNPKFEGTSIGKERLLEFEGYKQSVTGNKIYGVYQSSYKNFKYHVVVQTTMNYTFRYVDDIKISADETIKRSFSEFGEKLKAQMGKSFSITKAMSGDKLEKMTSEFIKSIIIVVVVGIIISIIIGVIIANKITEPVKELSFAAKKIGEGNLDYKINPKLFKRRDELGELAAQFAEMKDKLKNDIDKITVLERKKANAERLSTMGQMVSGIVHEIKNPLTSISGFAQVIEEAVEDPMIKKHTRTIMEEAERLNKLARDLLGYAKIQKLELERIRLKTLVENVYEKLGPKLKSKLVTPKMDIQETLPPVYGDKDRLTQVFINLISNSVEAMKQSGGTVEVKAERDGEKLIISCRDNGSGIPKEMKEKLFMPFVSGKKGGTGLGLALVKKIIEDHDGDIVLGDTEVGTEFIIKLPLKPENKE
jgi:signal transduction histidine kinase